MPFQYKIEYRWDSLKGPKPARKRGKAASTIHPPPPRPPPAAAAAARGRPTEQGTAAAAPAAGKSHKSESGAKSRRKPGCLEKVVLPAGCCVYYARGSGGQLMQSDPHQGKTSKSGHKGLGVVNPAVCTTHNVVEEEYAIIREVVEIYLEKQVSGGTEGNRYRVGGHIEDQKQLLEKLAQSLPADQGALNTADSIIVLCDPHDTPKPGTDPTTDDNAKPSQATGRTSRRDILPISKALQATLTPRGPFLVEGQAVRDTGPQSDSNVKAEVGGAPKAVGASEASGEGGEGPFTVGRIPLSPRVEDKKDEELERRLDVPRTVHQRYPDPLTVFQKQQKRRERGIGGVGGSPRPGRIFIVPHRNLPLQLVSSRSHMEVRRKANPRSNAGMTPQKADSEDAPDGKPPSPTFQTKGKRGAGGRPEHWKPVVSRRGYDPAKRGLDPPPAMKSQQVEGRSFVTRMPSKVILNVILPREEKSREGRLCGRLSGSNASGTAQQPLQAWLSTAPSPPPPPPPTAPADDEAEGLAAHYVLYHDQSDDGEYADVDEDDDDDDDDVDSGVHQDRYGSSQSGGSFFDTSAVSRSQNADQPASSSRAAESGGGSDAENGAALNASENAQPEEATAKKPPPPSSTAAPDEAARAAEELNPSTTAGNRTKKASSPNPAPGGGAPRSTQAPVPPLDLGKCVATAQSKLHSGRKVGFAGCGQGQQEQRGADPQVTSCRRAAHCDLLGPTLCADCEAAEHRRQFTARQDLLYPHIDVFPRHMVATQRFRGTFFTKGDHSRGQGWSKGTSSARWPYVSVGQLSNVVTDLDLCKRIVSKGHRAKLPTSFS